MPLVLVRTESGNGDEGDGAIGGRSDCRSERHSFLETTEWTRAGRRTSGPPVVVTAHRARARTTEWEARTGRYLDWQRTGEGMKPRQHINHTAFHVTRVWPLLPSLAMGW